MSISNASSRKWNRTYDRKRSHRPAPETGRKLPGWLIVLGIGVLFVGGLLILMLIKPPQKALCDGPAPDLTLTLFDEYRGGLPGETVKLSDLRGKGVVLNFWASWCKPCEEEAADLEAAWRKYKDQGIVFVGVDYLDQDPAAKRYLEKFDITFPTAPIWPARSRSATPFAACRRRSSSTRGQHRRLPQDRAAGAG